MQEKKCAQIVCFGIGIEIKTDGPAVFLKGLTLEEVEAIVVGTPGLSPNTKMQSRLILEEAKNFNAIFNEIRHYPEKGKLKFWFEFEAWEDFLGFKEAMEKLSQ